MGVHRPLRRWVLAGPQRAGLEGQMERDRSAGRCGSGAAGGAHSSSLQEPSWLQSSDDRENSAMEEQAGTLRASPVHTLRSHHFPAGAHWAASTPASSQFSRGRAALAHSGPSPSPAPSV